MTISPVVISRARRDYSALRASPLRGRPAGDRRRYVELSLLVCREFESLQHSMDAGHQAVLVQSGYFARPERFELPTLRFEA
jgi:hypothetical protein